MNFAKTSNYFKILSNDFPEWLNDYIDTKELQTQKYISTTCGTIYSDLFNNNTFYSSLDHSIAVALIVWHFTHDKKQTLAGLFHDIATPAFKHCVDFLNGDHLKQESTEELTTEFIEKSNDVLALLQRDNIKVEEIDNYHIYPIADNDTPKLSADRLEYSLSNALLLMDYLNWMKSRKFMTISKSRKMNLTKLSLALKLKVSRENLLKLPAKCPSCIAMIRQDFLCNLLLMF